MGCDVGEVLSATVYSDSSAVLGMVTRTGLGKVRHIRVQYLWLQERVACNDLFVRKVAGEVNPADLLTKGLNQELLTRHTTFCGLEARPEEGRKEEEEHPQCQVLARMVDLRWLTMVSRASYARSRTNRTRSYA